MIRKILKDLLILGLLALAGFIVGLIIRTQYFHDPLVWIWET